GRLTDSSTRQWREARAFYNIWRRSNHQVTVMMERFNEYEDRKGVKTPAAMKRKIVPAILVSALAQLALADSTVQQAQEELKEQGYYFGQINGDKNDETVAAIRRFQIRSGLQVTGELDQETVRALHAAS